MSKKPRYEYIQIHSNADKKRFKNRIAQEKRLETEKKRFAATLVKINERAISSNKINSAIKELKKTSPDFTKVKQVEQILEIEIGDLKANLPRISRIIRIERELHGIENILAVKPYRDKKNDIEKTIRTDQALLSNIKRMREKKEGQG